MPAPNGAYKRFGEAKTLARGRIHFARAGEINRAPHGACPVGAAGEDRGRGRGRCISHLQSGGNGSTLILSGRVGARVTSAGGTGSCPPDEGPSGRSARSASRCRMAEQMNILLCAAFPDGGCRKTEEEFFMRLYKTPFSRAYWKDALADFKKPRNLAFSALMVAVCVALSYLQSIPVVNNIRITWGFLARALCALVCGPVTALVFGLAEDTVSFLIHPTGGYNPFYAFTTMLAVLTYALFLYRTRVTVLRVFLAKLVTNLQNVFLGGLGTYLWYSSKGYWVIVGASAVKNAVMLPVQTVMLVILFSALLPILCRMGLLPRQALHSGLLRVSDWIAALPGRLRRGRKGTKPE